MGRWMQQVGQGSLKGYLTGLGPRKAYDRVARGRFISYQKHLPLCPRDGRVEQCSI